MHEQEDGASGTTTAALLRAHDRKRKLYPGCQLERTQDQPLFTLRQVNTIVESAVAEMREKLGEEYDAVLQSKLADQHAQFSHYVNDAIAAKMSDSSHFYWS